MTPIELNEVAVRLANMKGGRAVLHFDDLGQLMKIELDHVVWKKQRTKTSHSPLALKGNY